MPLGSLVLGWLQYLLDEADKDGLAGAMAVAQGRTSIPAVLSSTYCFLAAKGKQASLCVGSLSLLIKKHKFRSK